jgi:putative molybdopterin biosynthesis protein
VVILPGFPTSATFTFHEFVAPVIRALGGRHANPATIVRARVPMRVNSERGRTEYLLVGLVQGEDGLVAFPMGKGSGSVTTFSRADGFIVIPRQQEYIEADAVADVHLLSQDVRTADLVVIGSHCIGLDYLLGQLQDQNYRTKFLAVGSTGGLDAARRGECDLAGVHLLDAATGTYNTPFLTPDLLLVRGYARRQGLVYRPDDRRFAGQTLDAALARARQDPDCVLANRNRGSGTRILVDRLLAGSRPAGYSTEARTHHAVVAAVAQGRADWGIAIESVARGAGLGFIEAMDERYDFVMPSKRADRPAVQAFRRLLDAPTTRLALQQLGLMPDA